MEKEKITPEEFKNKMQEISENFYSEDRHIDADNLMCKVLIQLGYEEGVDIFYAMHKWYS